VEPSTNPGLHLGGKDACRFTCRTSRATKPSCTSAKRFNALSLAQERFTTTGQGAPPLADGILGPLPIQGNGGFNAASGHQRPSGSPWSDAMVTRRLRGGQRHHVKPAAPRVPSALPAAAQAARDSTRHTAAPAAPDPPASATCRPAIAAAVATDNVVHVDFQKRRVRA
jgi:hypothetical protein